MMTNRADTIALQNQTEGLLSETMDRGPVMRDGSTIYAPGTLAQ